MIKKVSELLFSSNSSEKRRWIKITKFNQYLGDLKRLWSRRERREDEEKIKEQLSACQLFLVVSDMENGT